MRNWPTVCSGVALAIAHADGEDDRIHVSWPANGNVAKPGRVLFELSGVDETTAREAMRRAQHKLPMKTRFISREAGEF